MLELKRKAHQAVLIGTSARLTVLTVGDKIVRVQLAVPGVTIVAPLTVGRAYQATIDGHSVSVELMSVNRGEVQLGIDAPRELKIDRAEVRDS